MQLISLLIFAWVEIPLQGVKASYIAVDASYDTAYAAVQTRAGDSLYLFSVIDGVSYLQYGDTLSDSARLFDIVTGTGDLIVLVLENSSDLHILKFRLYPFELDTAYSLQRSSPVLKARMKSDMKLHPSQPFFYIAVLDTGGVYIAHSTDNGITWSSFVRVCSLPAYDVDFNITNVSGSDYIHFAISYQDSLFYAKSQYPATQWPSLTFLQHIQGFQPHLSISGRNDTIVVVYEDSIFQSIDVSFLRSCDNGNTFAPDYVEASGSDETSPYIVWDNADSAFQIFYRKSDTIKDRMLIYPYEHSTLDTSCNLFVSAFIKSRQAVAGSEVFIAVLKNDSGVSVYNRALSRIKERTRIWKNYIIPPDYKGNFDVFDIRGCYIGNMDRKKFETLNRGMYFLRFRNLKTYIKCLNLN